MPTDHTNSPGAGPDRRLFVKTLGVAGGSLMLEGGGLGSGAWAQGAGSTNLKIVDDIGGLAATFWPFWAADDLGYFRDAKLDVSFILQPTQGVNLLLSGEAQVFGTAVDFVATAIDKGADIVAISTSLHSPTSMIGGKGVKTIADLKGKRIGVTILGSADTVLTNLYMEANGIKKGEFEVIAAGIGSEKIAAMVSGQISGVSLTQPQDYQIVQTYPDFTLLPDPHGTLVGGANRFVTFVNKTWAQKNRGGVVGFLKGQLKACAWLQDPANRTRAVALLVSKTNVPQKAAESTYDSYAQGGVFAEGISVNAKNIGALLEAAQAGGEGKFRPALEYFDLSYLEEAQKA